MKAPWTGQLSVAQTGWLFALLFFGWLAFLFVPAPKPEPEPTPPPVKLTPSRLVALGLPDNPDLEKLPEMFVRFSDKAPWRDEKTTFAYWHPGTQRFAYFFEATRTNGSFKFRTIPEEDSSRFPTESDTWPILFYPILYLEYDGSRNVIPVGKIFRTQSEPKKVEVTLERQLVVPPTPPLQFESGK